MSARTWAGVAATAALLGVSWPAAWAGIAGTKHDLSIYGPGPVKSNVERERCKFCHTPHTGAGKRPLWNRRDPGATYIRYDSPTLDAFVGAGAFAPDGATLMCLSCHDGTIALGALAHGPPVGDLPAMPSGSPANLGGDLSGTHPVSFAYTDDLVARNNARDQPLKALAEVRATKLLDGQGKVQCTSCHDPHDDSNRQASGVPFYRAAEYSEVCVKCHDF